jgi:protoporphyrinogen/coproporphyrinogen III oxidase
MIDVTVIGGGISGLATGYMLRRQGWNVLVLERQAKSGGNAISECTADGFLMEHGPSTVNATIPEALTLSRELGLEAGRCDLSDAVRRRFLVKDGGIAGIAAHPMGFLLSNYLSPGGRARLLGELLVPRRRSGGDETVADFCRRRFGSEFAERIMDPLVGGLYAGTADSLSIAAVFPRLVEMERRFGSITWAVLRARLLGASMPGKRLYSWRDGVGALPAALAARLGPSLRTGVVVRRLTAAPDGFVVDTGPGGAITTRAVAIATQPHVAAGLLEGVDADASMAAGEIQAPPLTVVFLGFSRSQIDHPLDGLGYLTPVDEGRSLTGAQFSSVMFPGRAPDGHVALTGYLGGARVPELGTVPADEAIALTRAEFHDLLGARGEPVIARARNWPRGIPQYGRGHLARLGILDRLGQSCPGLSVTGNYFDGPSVGACVVRAARTAAELGDYLATANQSVAGVRRLYPT